MDLFTFVALHPLLVGAFVALVIAFFINESVGGGAAVSPQQAVDLVNRAGAVIIDLRERNEFQDGHIVGAINVPHGSLKGQLDTKGLDKYRDRPIVLACKVGQHSPAAGTMLRQAGFKEISRLAGGMSEWRNQNLPVIKGKAK